MTRRVFAHRFSLCKATDRAFAFDPEGKRTAGTCMIELEVTHQRPAQENDPTISSLASIFVSIVRVRSIQRNIQEHQAFFLK